jgi:ABC-2 type transport system permease protein
MSTITAPPALRPRTHAGRVTYARVAHAEWTKLRSLRSTWYSLLAALTLAIGFTVITSAVIANQWGSLSSAERASFNPLTPSQIAITFAQLAIGVLGVLIVSGEYATGMVRSTFAAVPKRLPVLWAKAGVYGLVTLALAVPAMLIAFFAGQALLGGTTLNGVDISLAFSDPGVARAVIGGALYLTLVGIFGVGLGAIIRSSAGGISALAGVLFVLPPLMNVLPASWNEASSKYLPSNAGQAILGVAERAPILGPWTGLGLFAGYTAAAIVIAAVLLRRRDV